MLISTNIIRDSELDFDYVVTPNTQRHFESLSNAFGKHNKCFNLIGSYGTGKSSFLVAFAQTLSGRQHFFQTKGVESRSTFFRLVGKPASFRSAIAEVLGLSVSASDDEILDAVKAVGSGKQRVYFLVDEFGKYLEYALVKNPKEEIYFFQQFAELVNTPSNGLHWVNTLHQNFDSYSVESDGLDAIEWEKVSGRFVTLTFNEPASTLLKLIQGRLRNRSLPASSNVVENANQVIRASRVLPQEFIDAAEAGVKQSLPFDALTVFLTIQLLQRYGQNERSVFSFLSAEGVGCIANQKFGCYSPYDLVDYCFDKLAHFIFSNGNPDKLQWEAAERAVQRCDAHKELDPTQARLAVRTVLLVGLFGNEGSDFNKETLCAYMSAVVGADASSTVTAMLDKNIIQFLRHKGKLVFVEGTDVNIQNELRIARKHVSEDLNLLDEIVSRASVAPQLSRGHLIRTGSPRFMYFVLHGEMKSGKSAFRYGNGECHICLCNHAELRGGLSKGYPVLVVKVGNTTDLEFSMREVLLYEIVLEKYSDDLIVKQLVSRERDYMLRRLQSGVLDACFQAESMWEAPLASGMAELRVRNVRELNALIQRSFDSAYKGAPIVRNELINQSKLSVSINSARRSLMQKLEDRWKDPELGFVADRFPAEKSIFLSTWDAESLYDWRTGELKCPDSDSSYALAWAACESFLESSISGKVSVANLFETLEKAPFGLKRGFLSYWIPLYLLTKADQFALFYGSENRYLPYLTAEIFDSLIRRPMDFNVKKFNSTGVSEVTLHQYRAIAGIDAQEADLRSTYLKVFANFVLLNKQLNWYQKNTVNLSPEAIALREAIESASDPETALFVTIPAAAGFHDVASTTDERRVAAFMEKIRYLARELSNSYQELLRRISEAIRRAFHGPEDFRDLQDAIRRALQPLDKDRLQPRMRVLAERLCSPLDDHESWVKSVADVVLGRSLETITDEEEGAFHENLSKCVQALLAHSGISSWSSNSIAVTITLPDGSSERRYVERQIKPQTHLQERLKGLSTAERLALLALIVESENEKAQWQQA